MTRTKKKLLRCLILAPAALVIVNSAWAQVAPTTARPNNTPSKEETAAAAKKISAESPGAPDSPITDGDTIVLSPFEVVTDTKGYFSANTMSGTRFNTKLEDLASPISVLTKEQMTDFGMLDINDMFLYTVGTEGTGTYSDFAMNRNGELTDNVSLNPTQANRVRGIASANVSYGNFETMNRMPLDPLILEALEISRGPNANVFGLGNPSGTVNQVPTSANVTRNFTKVDTRIDDWDGYRVALDLNRYLIKDKLALRVSALNGREGFVRKPSGMDNRRYNAMIQFRPFKNTSINGSYLYYKSDGTRTNYTPPRDYVSYWVSQGKPGWDPTNQTIVWPNGTIAGPYLTDAALFAAPGGLAFNRTGGQFQRSNVFIDQGGPFYWTATTNNTGSSPAANTGSGTNFIRLYGTSPGPNGNSGKFTDQPLFNSVRSVTDQNLYDYNEINLASPNYISDRQHTYMVTVDQIFINTPMHLLAAQGGFFREESERYRKVPIGDSGSGGQNGQLWVDVNTKNIDGTPNPNFGRPYIGVNEPLYSYFPSQWDTSRAQLAYQLDLGQSKGFLKWFGKHTFTPYYEYKYRVDRKYTYREAIGSQHSWLVPGTLGNIPVNFAPANNAAPPITAGVAGPQAGPNIARPFYRFYVGDAGGTNVDYAPGPIIPGNYNMVWGTGGNWRYEPTALQLLATSSNTGGANNLKRVIKTEGAVLHSRFFDGKLVTTFGIREDRVYSKQGYATVQMVDNNRAHDFDSINRWENRDYRYSAGKTKTAGAVARPFRDLEFINRSAERDTGAKQFFAEALRGLTLSYNQSDNFIPSPPAIDLFLNPLPNQTGEGHDMGLWLNLFKEKLVIRVIRYENKQLNARDGDANTMAQRVLRLDLAAADSHQLFNRARDWFFLRNPGATLAQAEASALSVLKLTREQYDTLAAAFTANTLGAINDITSKGTEIEVNFNPTRHWTVSANFEEKKSINTNVSPTIQQWIDQRMPIWTTVVDPITDPTLILGTDANTRGWAADAANPNHLWWLHRYGSSGQSPAENLQVNVIGPFSILKETAGKSRPQIRRYTGRFSTNFKLSGISENRIVKNISIGGAVRWEDKGAIGYFGRETYPAVITSLDPNRPIYDESRAYFDFNAAYKTKFFSNRVGATFRLNIRNLQEGGRLQAVGAFPNGEIHSYRIIDPRQFILSATFDL